jgi:hypothetical protein
MMMRTANTAAKRLGRVDAHRAALNVPVNHDAASAVAAAAAFMGACGQRTELLRALRWYLTLILFWRRELPFPPAI